MEIVIEPALLSGLRIRPLKRTEYDQLVELGVFGRRDRIELLRGFLVEMAPQESPHSETVRRLSEWLFPALIGRARISVQLPFAATEDSEPEPDIAIHPAGNYARKHPERAHTVIEVSDTSLAKDRDVKAGIYAEAKVPQYWILDLAAKCVHVFSRPRNGRYVSVSRIDLDGELRLAKFPDVRISLRSILGGIGSVRRRKRRPKRRQ